MVLILDLKSKKIEAVYLSNGVESFRAKHVRVGTFISLALLVLNVQDGDFLIQ